MTEQRPEQDGPDEIEEAQDVEDEVVADAGHGRADEQRAGEAAHAADESGKAGDGPDLALVEVVPGHADDGDGGALVGEPGDAEEGDGHPGAGDVVDERDESHQEGRKGEGDPLGVNQLHPPAVEHFRAEPGEEAAHIGGEERQPGEEGDLLQVKMADGDQIERHPESQRRPGGVGKHPGQRDGPEVAAGQQGFQRNVATDHRRDVPASQGQLIRSQQGMLLRGAVGHAPEDGPEDAEDAGHDKGDPPVVVQDGPGDDGRGKHGPRRGADAVDPAGEPALPGGEPLGGDLHPGGVEGGFGEADAEAQYHHGDPGAKETGQGVKHRPENGHEGEDRAHPEPVHDVAGEDAADGIGQVKGGGDPGVLLLGKADLLQHGWGSNPECVAGQVVSDGAQHDQDNNVPSQVFDFHGVAPPFLRGREQILLCFPDASSSRHMPGDRQTSVFGVGTNTGES